MKIAVVADIHAHAHQQFSRIGDNRGNIRLSLIVQALKWVASAARKMGCKRLYFAGDLFHNRKAVSLPVLHEVGAALTELSGMFEGVELIVGNHDLSQSGDGSTSLMPLRADRAVIVHLHPTVTSEGVGIIPFTANAEEAEKAVKLCIAKKAKIIIGHLGLTGEWGKIDGVEAEKTVPPEVFRKFKGEVFLGHYHTRVTVGNIHYVGPLLQHTFHDMGSTPGFAVVDIGTGRFEFVENDISPRFVMQRFEDGKLSGDARECDYKQVVFSSQDAKANKALIRECASKGMKIKVEPEKTTQEVFLASASVDGILSEWVESKGVPEDDREAMFALGKELMTAVEA